MTRILSTHPTVASNVYRFDNDGAEVFSVPLPVAGGVTVMFAAYWAAVDEGGDIYILSWVASPDPDVVMFGLVSKVNGADGTLVWQRELPTSLDDAVNFFIADTNRITSRATDGLVARCSADGTQELWHFWDNSGPDSTSYYTKPLITSDGGVINYGTVGDATPGYPPTELVVDKFDEDGNITWRRRNRIGGRRREGISSSS